MITHGFLTAQPTYKATHLFVVAIEKLLTDSQPTADPPSYCHLLLSTSRFFFLNVNLTFLHVAPGPCCCYYHFFIIAYSYSRAGERQADYFRLRRVTGE
jgi:hypothetical protein